MIDNTWLLLAILVVCASISIYLGEKTKIGNKLGSIIIALVLGMILTNLNLIPAWSDVHGMVTTYLIGIAIPLFLFKVNFKKIIKLGPKLLLAFILGSIGVFVGAFIAAFFFDVGAETWKVYGAFAATNTGGSVNLAAVGNGLGISSSAFAAMSATDVIIFFFYMIFIISAGKIPFIRKSFKTSEEMGISIDIDTEKSKIKKTNLVAISIEFGAAVAVAALGDWIGNLVGIPGVIFTTIFALILAGTTKISEMTEEGEKIGSFFFNIFMVVIGSTAVFADIIVAGPTMLIADAVILVVHLLVIFIFGKLFNLPFDYIIMGSSGNFGGPTTAAPIALSYGYKNMVAPGILTGLMGIALGTFSGYGLAYILQSIL